MRKLALADRSKNHIKRIMVHDTSEDCFVYYYDTLHDQPCVADEWYATVEEAFRSVQGWYVSQGAEWVEVPDPPEGCQLDVMRPTKSFGTRLARLCGVSTTIPPLVAT